MGRIYGAPAAAGTARIFDDPASRGAPRIFVATPAGPPALTWDEIPGTWDNIAGTFDDTGNQ